MKSVFKAPSFIIHHSSFILPSGWVKKMSKEKRFYFWTMVGSIILVLIPIAISMLANTQKVEAAWFSDSWGYRQTVSVTSGTALTDFQIAITLDTATLISAGKMRSDCNDLRITDTSGQLLPYWIEEGSAPCNNASTKIWTKVPAIHTSGNTLLVYYGNTSTGTSVQNGNRVFDFFDDFNKSLLDGSKWIAETRGTGGAISLSSGAVNLSPTSNTISSSTIRSKKNFTKNIVFELRRKQNTNTIYMDFSLSSGNLVASDDGGSTNWWHTSASSGYVWYYQSGSTADGIHRMPASGGKVAINTGALSFTNSAYTVHKMSYGPSGQLDWSVNGSSVRSGTDSTFLNNEKSVLITQGEYVNGNGDTQSVDWFFVRKYSATEPTVGLPSNEEKARGPVGYWKFDEGTGSKAYDATSNRHNGDITGASWTTEEQCVSKNCLKFDNTKINTKYASVNDSSFLDQSGDLSISAWYKTNTQPTSNGDYKVLVIYNNSSTLTSKYQSEGYNVVIDTSATTIEAVAAHNPDIVVCDRNAWSCSISLLNSLYDAGYSIASIGNDTGNGIRPISSSFSTSVAAGTIGTDEKHPIINGWSTTGSSGSDGRQAVTALHASAVSVAYDQTNGWKEIIYLEEPGKGRWIHYQSLASPSTTLFDNANAMLLRYNIVGKGKNYNLYTYNGSVYGFLNNQKLSGSSFFDQWNHVSLIYDKTGGNAYLYLNGKQISTIAYSTELETDSTSLSIGTLMKGFLDEIKIYPYVRTSEQIKLDYNSRGSVAGVSTQIANDLVRQGSLANGLVGYWKQDEATWSGTLNEVVDSSGNGNHGQAQGATSAKAYPTSGKFGNGGYTDGVDDYTQIADSNSLDSSSGWTIGGWFKPTDTVLSGSDRQVLISKWQDSTSQKINYYLYINTNGRPYAAVASSACNASATTVAGNTVLTNRWYHIMASFEGKTGQLKIFVDGKLENTSSTGYSASCTNTGNVVLGKYDFNWTLYRDEYKGSMDEIRVYNRTLSSSEVTKLHNYTPGPVAYYDFEQKSGTTLPDKSGNGNNSTSFTGSPKWSTGKYGNALSFNGSSDNVAVPVQNHKNITVSGWVYRTSQDASNADAAFGGWYWNSDSQLRQGYDLRFYINRNYFDWVVETTDGLAVTEKSLNSPSLELNRWYHVAGTYDSATGSIKLYIDGNLVSSNTSNAGNTIVPLTQYSDMRIGYSRVNNGYFPGKIDEVRIYNYARTAGQIVEDMNASHPIGGSPVGSQVGHWKFDEGYGSTAKNSGNAGSTLNGTITAAIWKNEGKFGKTLNYDGSGDYVTISDNSALDFGLNSFSVSYWLNFNPGSSQERWSIGKGTPYQSSGAGWAIAHWSTGNPITPSLYVSDGTGAPTSHSVSFKSIYRGNWHLLTFVVDRNANLVKTYVDGVYANQLDISSLGSFDNNNDLLFGTGNGTGNTSDVKIDEVKIYNTALTGDQIKLDMNQGKSMVLGSFGTDSNGKTASNSASRVYCVPGDTATCSPPVAEWKMEEGSGANIQDTSGNGKTGSFTGGNPTWGQGKFGKGLVFDGSTGVYATVGSPVTSPTAWTYSAWIKPRSAASGTDSFIGQSNNPALRWRNNSTVSLFVGWSETPLYKEIGSGTLALNKWHNIVGVVDTSDSANQTLKLYVNGVLVNSTTATTGTLTKPSSTHYINRRDSTSLFSGSVDEVRIYDYARTPAQIAWDYNQGKPVAHWKFDECQGTTAYDSSENGSNGTITIGGTGTQTSAGTCQTASTAWGNGSTGKFNSSLNFDGTDDQVATAANISSLNITGSMTLLTWIKPSSVSQGQKGLIVKRTTNTSSPYTYFINSAKIRFSYYGIDSAWHSYDSIDALSTAWQHTAYVYNSNDNTLKFYINGKQVGPTQNTTSTPTTSNTQGLTIGCDAGWGCFNGQMDDVRIYNYALTDYQVKQVMNQGAAIRWGPATGSP